MNETIKKTFKRFTAAAAALALVASFAVPSGAVQPRKPKAADGGFMENLDFVGANVCRSLQTTSPKSCATSSGILLMLCAYGTAVAVGKGAIAFDSANPTHGSPTLQKDTAISPIVYGTGATGVSSIASWEPKCWAPKGGSRFENGMGLVADDGSVSILALYRLDTGANP
jgi:hypothetical protein